MNRTWRTAFIGVALFVGALAVVASETYRGNAKSRVFHQSSCRYYACKNCIVTFESAREAVERGFRPCGVCEPGGVASQSANIDAAYSGNTSTRKFHRSSCRYSSCKNCNARFESRQQAIDAGYVPGGCCKP